MSVQYFAELKPNATVTSSHDKDLKRPQSAVRGVDGKLGVTHSACLVRTVSLSNGCTGNKEELGEQSLDVHDR